MSQLAKLFLRGSITHTIRDLSDDQRQEIDDIICSVAKDPNLQNTKYEFCNALRRTIGSEYADRETAMEEFYIALMKAAVAAKYGWGSHDPVPDVLTDPLQRKKWFQTWTFEFLRQILRENKIPSYKHNPIVKLPANEAAVEEVKAIIRKQINRCSTPEEKKYFKNINKSLDVIKSGNNFHVIVDHWTLPIDLMSQINKLTNKYLSYDVKITQHTDRIRIESLDDYVPNVGIKKQQEVRVKFASFEAQRDEDDNSNKIYLEYQVSSTMNEKPDEVAESDNITALRKTLPDDAIRVLNLIVDPPDDYVDQFGTRYYKSHIAKYLGTTPREIEKVMGVIRVHAMTIGMSL